MTKVAFNDGDYTLRWILIALSLLNLSAAPQFRSEAITVSSAPEHDFGFVTPPADKTDTLTLTNSSNYTVVGLWGSANAPFSYEGGNFPGTSGTCTSTLAPGDSCNIAVTFDPTNTALASDTISVTYGYELYPGAGVTTPVAVKGNDDNCSLDPTIVSVTPSLMNVSSTRTFSAVGSFFEPTSTVLVPGHTVSSTTYVDNNQITFEVTSSATTGFTNVQISNGCGDAVSSNAIEVKSLPWVDLRSTGDALASLGLATRGGVNAVRDATGMYFTGTTGWGAWVQFQNYTFIRGANDALEMVFLKNSASTFMLGVGSDAQNFASNAQYFQVESNLYTPNNALWGYYGNTGTVGTGWNQDIGSVPITYGNTYKVRFENDGANGETVSVYQVDPSNWDSITATIDASTSTNNANEANLVPTVIAATNGTTYRIVGFRVEN